MCQKIQNSKWSKTVMIATTLMLIICTANAQDKMKIAVMDFNPGIGVDESMVNGLSDMLINSLFDTRKFTIIERTQLDKAIQEQGFQKSNLSAGQIAQVGKILGVKSILVGTVNFIATGKTTEQVKTGMITGEYNLDVRIVDVESGEIVSTAGVTKTNSKTYRELMPVLADDLTSKLFGSTGNNKSGEIVELLGYLYVFPEDLGVMSGEEARMVIKNLNAANTYGFNDWWFPSATELQILHQNREKLKGIADGLYLSISCGNEKGYCGIIFGSNRDGERDFAREGHWRPVRKQQMNGKLP